MAEPTTRPHGVSPDADPVLAALNRDRAAEAEEKRRYPPFDQDEFERRFHERHRTTFGKPGGYGSPGEF